MTKTSVTLPRHSVSVAGVVVNEEGRVLAIRRRDNGQWQAPGGVLELQETFEQGVRREVLEETGVTVEVDRLTGVYKNLRLGVVALVFRCRPIAGAPRPTAESSEACWLTGCDVVQSMSPAFAVRITDALAEDAPPAFRTHDGINLMRATAATASIRKELTALVEAGASQIIPWQSRVQHGEDLNQVETSALEASAKTIIGYDHSVVHGLLQVREYARLVLQLAGAAPHSLASSVENRMRRQSVLLDQSRRFDLLMTEAALRWRPGSVQLQLEQLRQIGAVMALPNVRIGLLPLSGQARAIYPEGFQVYADRADDADTIVVVELVTDEITLSEPGSVALYRQEFSLLCEGAFYDGEALTLLDRLATELSADS